MVCVGKLNTPFDNSFSCLFCVIMKIIMVLIK